MNVSIGVNVEWFCDQPLNLFDADGWLVLQ